MSDSESSFDLPYSLRIVPETLPSSTSAFSTGLGRQNITLRAMASLEIPLVVLLLVILLVSILVAPGPFLRVNGLELPELITCPLLLLAGIPCLFCGMTRSFMAMGGMDIQQAFLFHPLGPVLFVLMLSLIGALLISILTRSRFKLLLSRTMRRSLIAGFLALLVASWPLKIWIWSQAGIS